MIQVPPGPLKSKVQLLHNHSLLFCVVVSCCWLEFELISLARLPVIQYVNNMTDPRVLKSHLPLTALPWNPKTRVRVRSFVSR